MGNYPKKKRPNSSDDEVGGDANQKPPMDGSIILPSEETYEVFLSFRGPDTRKGFTDHLYMKLRDAGVHVFRDDDELRVGEPIGPALERAIKDSKVLIPIISPTYAHSEWCLQELVRILERKKTGQVVLPILHGVQPWILREQADTFEDAFRLHEEKYGSNSKVVKDWRAALKEVTSDKVWESSKIEDGYEGKVVNTVVTEVLNKLRKATLYVKEEDLVGIEDHKEKILEMLESNGSSNAKVIVIHGMGGIGKTTLAKIVFNHLSTSFKHCSFLENIRERLTEGKCLSKELQKQLVSNILGHQWSGEISNVDDGKNIIKDRLHQKKVLILFDDVDHTDQLNALAGEHSWFKSSSILIITTRDKDVLKEWKERLTYELEELDFSNSFTLFCKHAFRKQDESCVRKFNTIAKDIVSTAGGLPLAIEVIGKMLLDKCRDYWEDAFKKLQNIPQKHVQKKLRITYDSLEYEEKQIFLDIACLPMRGKIDIAIYMWDACKLSPKKGIEELISRSLIKRGQENQVTIHDQLRALGRAIVLEEDNGDPRNRSRLWNPEEALQVMLSNQGTSKIQVLHLWRDYGSNDKDYNLTSEAFKNLTNLRFLRLINAKLVGDFKNLLLNLRWLQLEWWYSLGSSHIFTLPTNFHPKKLVVLELLNCTIRESWEGWAHSELVKNLKVLKFKNCISMPSTPDFSAFKKLEILILDSLVSSIHPSIRNLKKTLLTLDVRGCMAMHKLPDEIGELEELRQLLVDWIGIKTFPNSIGNMTKLQNLSASHCVFLENLPYSIGSLSNLVSLSLDNCPLEALPKSIGNLNSLTKLDISYTSIETLPASIRQLRNLQLTADGLNLTEVPEEIDLS